MKAILCRYHGHTDRRGSRISARAEGCPVRFYPYDYAHAGNSFVHAAMRYAREFKWTPVTLHAGRLPDGSEVFTMGNDNDTFTVTD